jgi:hypothetical protein
VYYQAVKAAVYGAQLTGASPATAFQAGVSVPRPPSVSAQQAAGIVAQLVAAAYTPQGITASDLLGLGGHYIAHPGEGVGVSANYLQGLGTGVVGQVIRALVPILKVAAGGVGLLVVGVAVVYVAGRNTAPVAATKEAVRVATPAGRVAGAAGKAGARAVRNRPISEREYARREAAAGGGGREGKVKLHRTIAGAGTRRPGQVID